MRIVARFHVSLDWLIFNKGTMFGEMPIDLTWYQAIVARLLLGQMMRLGVVEAFELAENISAETVDKSKWSPAQLELDRRIWQMCEINHDAVAIYNEIMKLGTEQERLDYVNQLIAPTNQPTAPADSWQNATQQHHTAQSLQQKLQWISEE